MKAYTDTADIMQGSTLSCWMKKHVIYNYATFSLVYVPTAPTVPCTSAANIN